MNQTWMLVVFRPKTVIAATLVVTLAMLAALFTNGISFNGSPEVLARNDDALNFYNEIKSTFGDDRVIIAALTTEDVFTAKFLERLDRLTADLEGVDGVAEAHSLANIKFIKREDGGIRVERLIPRDAFAEGHDPARLQQIKQTVTHDPLYAPNYISADGRTAAINVFIKPLAEAESRAVAEKVERLVKSGAGEAEVLLAGVPIMDSRGIRSMVRDMLVCSPVAALLCFVVFLAAFRSFWGAALPMAALLIGLVWVIGLMSVAGRPITIATLSLPTVLMAVGGSYIFHVLNQYRISMSHIDSTEGEQARRAVWLNGLRFIGPAVIVSGTTTMAGFGSLASSSVPTARDMGLFEAIGVLAMLLLSLAFVPAVLSLLPPQALGHAGGSTKDYAHWLNRLLSNITALILYRRRAILILSLVLTLLAGAGAWWLRVNTDYLKIFPSKSETVQAAEKLHERLAGAATVQIVVSGTPGAIYDPGFLRGVAALEEFALAQPGVDAAFSAADIVRRLNSLLVRDGIGAEEIPNDRARITSIFDDFLLQDNAVSRLVSRDRSRAIIILRTNLFGSNELRALTAQIDEWSRANLPAGISSRATGSFVLLNDASDAIAVSQSSSLLIALSSIYLMMVVLFRSFSTALLALIPNLLPLAGFFGFLGWAGVALDITTSLVASAVLGLAVDNAVHMIRRYRQSIAERKQASRGRTAPDDEEWAMWLTMLRTGKPTVLANLMLIVAFMIFMLSSFIPVRVAGMLWAVTIFACLAADLILLPALMKSWPFARVTLNDSGASGGQAIEQEYPDVEKMGK